jgi:hypothetical protein
MSSDLQTKDCVKEIVKYNPFYLQSILMKEFMKECEKKLFDSGYLSQLESYVNEMAAEEPNKFLHFLLEIGFYATDDTKEKILRYVLEKYPNDIKMYDFDIYHIIRNMNSSKDKIKWIERLISSEQYEYLLRLNYSIYKEIDSKDLYDRYIKNYRSLIEMEKENEILRKHLEVLEAHIHFMPEGKGYQEAKKNFEEIRDDL